MAVGILANAVSPVLRATSDLQGHEFDNQLKRVPVFMIESTSFEAVAEFLENPVDIAGSGADISLAVPFPVSLGALENMSISAGNQTSDKPVDTERGLSSFISVLTESPETLRVSGTISNLLAGSNNYSTDIVNIIASLSDLIGSTNLDKSMSDIRSFNEITNQEFSILTTTYRIFNIWKKRGSILEFLNTPISLRRDLGIGYGFGTLGTDVNKYLINDFSLDTGNNNDTEVARYSVDLKFVDSHNRNLVNLSKTTANQTTEEEEEVLVF